MAKDAKKELLHFIDQKAFDVILRKDAKHLDEGERKALETLQDKTENENDNVPFLRNHKPPRGNGVGERKGGICRFN